MKLKPNLWNVLVTMWVISLSTATVSFGAWSAIEFSTVLKPAKIIYANTGIAATELLILYTGVCKLLERHERWQCLRRVKQQFLNASESEKYDCFINLVNLAGFRFSDVRMTQEERREAMRYLIRHGILNVFAPGDQQFEAWSIAEENHDQTEREWSMQHLPDQPEPLHGSPLSLNAQMTGKSCHSCKFYYGTDGVHCAVRPSGPESDACRDWEQAIETYTWGFIGVKYADRHVYYTYHHDADDGGYINVLNNLTDRGVMALSPSNQQMFLHYFGLQYPSALPKKTFRSEHWESREAIAQIRSMSSHS